jgi:hypothetical protein
MGNDELKGGFTYRVEHIRAGELVGPPDIVCNLMPTEGKNYVLNASLKGGSVYNAWYVGLFEGNITPVIGNVMSSFPTDATECTAYAEATREILTLGTVASGSVNNSASPAEFTFNATKTVYGCFVATAGTKSATTGPLLSAVRFTTAKDVISGDIIRVIGGFTLTDA